MVSNVRGKMQCWRNGDWEFSNKMSGDDYGQDSEYSAVHWLYELFFGSEIVDGHSSHRGSWCVHSGYMEIINNGRMTVTRWHMAPIHYDNKLGQLAGIHSTLKVEHGASTTCAHGGIQRFSWDVRQLLQCSLKTLSRGVRHGIIK